MNSITAAWIDEGAACRLSKEDNAMKDMTEFNVPGEPKLSQVELAAGCLKVIGEKSELDFVQAVERLRSSMAKNLSEYLDYAAVGPADIDALEKESRERLRMMDVIGGVKHFRDPSWPMPEKRRSRSTLTPAQRDERRARNKAQRKARKKNR